MAKRKRRTQAEKDAATRAYLDRKQRIAARSVFDELNEDGESRLKRIDAGDWKDAVDESLQQEYSLDDIRMLVICDQNTITWYSMISLDDMALHDMAFYHDIKIVNGHYVNASRAKWQAVVDNMTKVQKMVHLAKRYAIDEIATIKAMLLRMYRRAYEAELTIQARHVGCDKQGSLTNENILADLDTQARDASEDIANTYNYDLALAIGKISSENRYANRHYYAKHLRAWEQARNTWKIPQVQRHEANSARSTAMGVFYERNQPLLGIAELWPKRAVCPVCQGWINRGVVVLRIALHSPPPYHVGCPHLWHTRPNKIARELCKDLWVGQ